MDKEINEIVDEITAFYKTAYFNEKPVFQEVVTPVIRDPLGVTDYNRTREVHHETILRVALLSKPTKDIISPLTGKPIPCIAGFVYVTGQLPKSPEDFSLMFKGPGYVVDSITGTMRSEIAIQINKAYE